MSQATEPTSTAAPRTADTENAIVVGIDGSPGSAHALAWAALRTDQFGLIQPVSTWQYPWWAVSGPMTISSVPAYDELADLAAQHVSEVLSSVPSELRLPPIVTQSAPGPTLVEYGANANLIVVGTRGRGAVADALLGSVSCHVVSHATVPVAVVPAGAALDDQHRRIVVGVDGSANSVEALTWALRTAAPDQVVEAVHTWSYVIAAFPEAPALPIDEFEAAATATLDNTIAAATAAAGTDPEAVERVVVEGDPRLVLREASKAADVLVVGARGHRGFVHAVLGSVTTGLVHQPLTVTVVVPSPK